MGKIDIVALKPRIVAAAAKAFSDIVNLPPDIRQDEKERTGAQILVIEPDTRNLAIAGIGNPSDAAKFFSVEKAVRSRLLGHASSANSTNPELMRYAGSVTVCIGGVIIQASCSGLSAAEDMTISILVLAAITGLSAPEIVVNIEDNRGVILKELKDKDHYLYAMIYGK